ncbi:hypothetical protein [Sodalis sp.]|uniref:hypothetical protein n=1 Tax=Sodalis sp. (in: enterobacteria) TaxID=1898979 RepID=UPI0038737F52
MLTILYTLSPQAFASTETPHSRTRMYCRRQANATASGYQTKPKQVFSTPCGSLPIPIANVV